MFVSLADQQVPMPGIRREPQLLNVRRLQKQGHDANGWAHQVVDVAGNINKVNIPL
jgi:hypothetical protein